MDATCQKCGKVIGGRARANVWDGQYVVCTACLNGLKADVRRAGAIAGIAGTAGADWLVHDGRQQYGPYPTAQLIQLLSAGRVKWEWTVWREGMAKWTPAAQLFTIPELTNGRVELRDFGQGDGTHRPRGG